MLPKKRARYQIRKGEIDAKSGALKWEGETIGYVLTDGIVKSSTPPRSPNLPRAGVISIAEIEFILLGKSILPRITGLIAKTRGTGHTSF